MEELMSHWLWMKAMEYAIDAIMRRHQGRLYPMDRYDEWCGVNPEIMERNVATYALENWETPSYQGSGSGHSRLSIGLNVTLDGSGCTAKYRGMEITVKWPTVKKFIREMLEDEPKDTQITMFEALLQEVEK